MTHICVSKLTIIGSDNGLSPRRRQAIIWTNAGILLFRPLGTKFSDILIEIPTFSFKKMHLKMSSAKWRPFCLGPNVLKGVRIAAYLGKKITYNHNKKSPRIGLWKMKVQNRVLNIKALWNIKTKQTNDNKSYILIDTTRTKENKMCLHHSCKKEHPMKEVLKPITSKLYIAGLQSRQIWNLEQFHI